MSIDGLLCEVRKTFSYHFQVGLRSLFRVAVELISIVDIVVPFQLTTIP